MSQVSIDVLKTQKSHIDLSDRQLPTDFGLNDYKLSKLFDDVMLLEYCDVKGGEDGNDYIERNGIAIPVSQVHNAWRKGKVILKGPNVKYTEVGDIVVFPNNMGIPISNLEVTNHGKVKNGLFLNEQRMFGICQLNIKDEENQKD
jgi:cellobiose-specific phosphotransferase system component IIB